MKEGIIIILAALVILVLIVGCANTAKDKTTNKDIGVFEWVSPDGVHYWCREGERAVLAPRYDRYGNLVID